MTLRYPDGVREVPRMGRPRVDEPLEPVATRLPRGVYDQLCLEAAQREMKLSELVRNIVIMRLPPKV
jgi:hypothetical protein